MRLAWKIARRYLLSRRLPGAVNVITWVAIAGIGLVSAALIIVLSVFNGFNGLISSLYQSFDPELRVQSAQEEFITQPDSLTNWLRNQPGVGAVNLTLEGRALLKYRRKQQIIRLKGVQPIYEEITAINRLVNYGEFSLQARGDKAGLVMGAGVAQNLRVVVGQADPPLIIYTLSEKKDIVQAGELAMRSTQAMTNGIFQVQKQYDEQYVLADLTTVQRIFDAQDKITALELKLKPGYAAGSYQHTLQDALGASFDVRTVAEQHATLYRILRNEKVIGFALLTLMLLLVSVNILGSLTMIVIEKQQDIGMLQAFGADAATIRRIFLTNSLLTGGLGGILGLGLGSTLVVLQERFGLVKLRGAENFIIDHFPVDLLGSDIAWSAGVILVLSLLAGLYPAERAARSWAVDNLR
jgi:lipoprotein-releasing system permease protein